MKYYIITYTGKPIGESGEICDTNYNLERACKTCGTGATIIGSLRTKRLGSVKKNFFQTIDGDTLISEKLYKIFNKKCVKIGGLKKVLDINGNELPFYHLYTDFFLPKATMKMGLILENQCKTCERNGFFNDVIIGNLEKNIDTIVAPIMLTYTNLKFDFLNQSDIFNTWEHMGLSCLETKGRNERRFARPLLIVSERLRSLMVEEKIGGIKYEDVKFRVCKLNSVR